MKSNSISSLLILFYLLFHVEILRGQQGCDCSIFKSYENTITHLIYFDFNNSQHIQQVAQPLLNSPSPSCQAKGFEFLADVFFNKNQIDSIEYYIKKAENVHAQQHCHESQLYELYLLKTKLFYQKQDYNEAINYGYKALSVAEKDNTKQAEIMAHISRIFSRLQQYDKTLEYTRRALQLIQAIPPSVKKAILLEILAQNYNTICQVRASNLYVTLSDKMSAEKAEKAVRQQTIDEGYLDTLKILTLASKSLAQQYDYKPTLVKTFRHLQTIEINLDHDDKALAYIDSSLMHCNYASDYSGLFVGYGDKADIYFKQKNSVLATRFADSCLLYAKKLGTPMSIANAYYTVSDIAELSKDWQKAFYALREVKIIMDSVQNIERTKVVNELEKKYNQAKNEKTIKELAQEKRIYLLLALAALLGIVIFMFYMRQQTLKHKQTILETEQRLNRARMNPHFFFNALTSLQSFALRENDGKMLASNLSKFSHIMRETLESTYKEYVTIEQEIEFLNEYLEIQKIRFPKKFAYHIEADADVEIDEILIPSMIIQPFVENSIEHGFAGLDEEGLVNVHFKKVENEVLIEVSDNGRGLSSSTKITNEHISRASQIIKDRIYLLNIKLKTKARFSIDNQDKGQGVLVNIYLPIIYQNDDQ